jgi:hypothetical protein
MRRNINVSIEFRIILLQSIDELWVYVDFGWFLTNRFL